MGGVTNLLSCVLELETFVNEIQSVMQKITFMLFIHFVREEKKRIILIRNKDYQLSSKIIINL